jgi:hypothetical protein
MGMISMDLFDATPREFSVLDYLFNPNRYRKDYLCPKI